MGDRTFEAQLTLRLWLMAGIVLVLVGAAAVVVTDRVLDASDTANARTIVLEARDMLSRELNEGDSLPDALDALTGGTDLTPGRPAVRLTVRAPNRPPTSVGLVLPPMAASTCATVLDPTGSPWRGCEAALGPTSLVAAVPVTHHRRAVGDLAKGMVAVLFAAMCLLWVAIRRAVRKPIGELALLVGWTSLVVDAREPVPVPRTTTREVAQLAQSLNRLVGRLLEALTRERASSAHIAHELRTPLAALLAQLDTLTVQDQNSREAVEGMRADLRRFADVIDAILVLSSSAASVRTEAVVNVADLVRSLAPEGAQVSAPDEALVEADEALLALALRNLLENGKRHGRGVRAVAVAREGGALRISVTDNGPGVEPERRVRMFERYWRGVADGEGQGLGLALVKAVAERHGGRAFADAAPSGVGFCVSMTLGRLLEWHEADAASG
jgi:signal transduction histidine kinase